MAVFIEQTPGQERGRAANPASPLDGLAGELGLHGFEHGGIEDRRVITAIGLAMVDDLSKVEAILQEMGEPADPDFSSAHRSSSPLTPNGDIWDLLLVEGDRTPLARPRQKDIPIPVRPRAYTPLGEAVSSTPKQELFSCAPCALEPANPLHQALLRWEKAVSTAASGEDAMAEDLRAAVLIINDLFRELAVPEAAASGLSIEQAVDAMWFLLERGYLRLVVYDERLAVAPCDGDRAERQRNAKQNRPLAELRRRYEAAA